MSDKQLTQLAHDLSAALPGNWTVKPIDNSWYVMLTRDDSAELSISNGRKDSTRHISSGATVDHARDYLPYQDKFPDIHVSKTKSAAVIARDIERRIFPELERLLVIVLKGKAERDAHNLLTLNNAARLSALLDRDEPRISNDGYQAEVSNYIGTNLDEHRHAKVTIRGNCIEIEIDALTVGEAEAILRIARGEDTAR